LIEVLVALVIFAALAMGVMTLTGGSIGTAGRLKASAASDAAWGPILRAGVGELAKAAPAPKIDTPWTWQSPWGPVRVRFVAMNELAQDDIGVVRVIWEDPANHRPPVETEAWFNRTSRQLIP
jgi:hypothetical protein